MNQQKGGHRQLICREFGLPGLSWPNLQDWSQFQIVLGKTSIFKFSSFQQSSKPCLTNSILKSSPLHAQVFIQMLNQAGLPTPSLLKLLPFLGFLSHSLPCSSPYKTCGRYHQDGNNQRGGQQSQTGQSIIISGSDSGSDQPQSTALSSFRFLLGAANLAVFCSLLDATVAAMLLPLFLWILILAKIGS